MQKFLVLGDVHIGDYPKYNNISNRLNQFELLADRLCQFDANGVIIAGDLLLNCIMKPRVMHVVNSFCEKLCNKFGKVYYILGNHDLDIKIKGFSEIDSLVTLIKHKGFVHMHDKHLKVEDTDIYFMDWIRSREVPLTENCDIFISHINLMPGFGQQVNNSKFKLGIFGDYHSRFQVENMMTTGTPIQHYKRDPIEPKVLELEINGSEFKTRWIELENDEFKFIKMYGYENYPQNPTKYDILIPGRKKSEETKEIESKVQFELASEVSKIIEDSGLTSEHKKVIELHGDIEPIDMEFKLNRLWAFNYRSIRELDYEFSDNRVVYLCGSNGSGKSTFLRALISALFGDIHLRDKTTKGENWNEVGVVLTYQGRVHEIQRKNGYLGYKVDGVSIDANNMKSLQSSIDSNLPFLPYLWDFIVDSHTTFFAKCNRLELFTRLFELDRYSLYSNSASELKSVLESDRNELHDKIYKLSTESKVLSERLDEISSNLESEIPVSLESSFYSNKISELSSNLDKFKWSELSINKISTELNSTEDIDESEVKSHIEELTNVNSANKAIYDKLIELNFKKSELSRLNSVISKGVSYKCEKCGHEGVYNSEFKELKSKIDELESEISRKSTEIGKFETLNLKQSISAIDSRISTLSIKLEKYNYTKKLKSELEKNLNELNSLKLKYCSKESLESELDSIRQEELKFKQYQLKLSEIEKLKNKIQSNSNSIKEFEVLIEDKSKKISAYESYINLFDVYNLDSIPNKILNSIVSSISDDTIEFTTHKDLKSGKVKFAVSCTMNVDGEWIDFDDLSDGQQSRASLKILSKLSNCLPKVGLVILDEPLKHVDESNLYECINSLKNTNCNTLLISSHSPSYNYADEMINFELVNGVSSITREKL